MSQRTAHTPAHTHGHSTQHSQRQPTHTRSRSTVTLGHTFVCDIMSLTTEDEIGALIARFKAVKRSEAPWWSADLKPSAAFTSCTAVV